MRQFLCLFSVVLCNEVLYSQQRRDSEEVTIAVKEYMADKEAVRHEKLKFYKSNDPSGRYPLEMHQALWDKNIKLALLYTHADSVSKNNDEAKKLQIDAFGLSTTKFIHEKFPELSTQLMKTVGGEFVGKSIDFDQLYKLILDLKTELDQVWQQSKNREYGTLILRAGLANHLSRMSKKQECWLLVEVFHARDENFDLFIRDVVDLKLRFKKRSRDMHELDPMDGQVSPGSHPTVQESRFLDKNRVLQQNRNELIVTVQDDKLTIPEREAMLGFQLVNETGRKFHQIESCSWPDVDDSRAFKALSQASELVSERIPSGSFLSVEELHLRLGSVAKVLQRRFPQHKLIIRIREYKPNAHVYSALHLDVKLLD